MRILVITSCTKEKQDLPAPAAQMYTGRQHHPLMVGLEQLRTCYGKSAIDLAVISAKYGLLSECRVIAPYDFTFKGLDTEAILELSDKLKIHKQVGTLISKYDVVFFLLGEKYVRSLRLPFEGLNAVTQIFLLGDSYKNLIPDLPNMHFVSAGTDLANKLGKMVIALKGIVFKKLCEAACRDGFQVFEQVKRNPQRLIEIVLNQ